MKIIFLCIVWLGMCLAARSQSFRPTVNFCDSCEREIFLRFKSASFLKNDEYFSEYTKGFTGIGFYLQPSLQYYFNQNTQVNVGAYLLKYSGVNNFSQTIPIFRVHHKFSKQASLILGNIYGTFFHQLDEPLYRFDRYYQNNVEYGMQFLYDSRFFTTDLWINWEKFILKDDPFQEEFVAGNNSNFFLIKKNAVDVKIPVQFMFYHKGGQVDSSPDPVITLFNAAAGIDVGINTTSNRRWGFEHKMYLYQGLGDLPETGTNAQHFKDGVAYYSKIKYESKWTNAILGYWFSQRFISPKGEYLFLNISEHNPDFYQRERQIITAKLALKYKVTSAIKTELRADTYYDIINKDLAFSFGLYFVIDEYFYLGKTKAYQFSRKR